MDTAKKSISAEEITKLFREVTGFTLRPLTRAERFRNGVREFATMFGSSPDDARDRATYFALAGDVALQADLSNNKNGHLHDPDEIVRLATLLNDVLPNGFQFQVVRGKLRIAVRGDGYEDKHREPRSNPLTFNHAKEYLDASRDVIGWLCKHYDAYLDDVDSGKEMIEYRNQLHLGRHGKTSEDDFGEVTAARAAKASRESSDINEPIPFIKRRDGDNKYIYYTFMQPVHIWATTGSGGKHLHAVKQINPDPAAEAIVARLNEIKPAGPDVTFFIIPDETKKYTPFRLYFRRNDGAELQPQDIKALQSYRSDDERSLVSELDGPDKFGLYEDAPGVREALGDNRRSVERRKWDLDLYGKYSKFYVAPTAPKDHIADPSAAPVFPEHQQEIERQ